MTGLVHRELEFDRILEMLAEQALSDNARERIMQLRPYMNEREALRHMEDTTAARSVIEKTGSPPLASMTELNKAVSLLEIDSYLGPEQLEAIAGFISTCLRMKRYLKRAFSASESISGMERSINDLTPLRSEIDNCIRDGRLDDRASSELSSIRRNISLNNDRIRDRLNGIIRANGQYLSEGFIVSRNGKLTLAVKREYRNRITGSVVDKSNSGGTIFMEPDSVAKIQKTISTLLVEEDIEIKRILYTLTAMVEENLPKLRINIEAMETLDFIFAKAKLSIDMDAVPARLTPGCEISLKGGIHPLLDKREAVPLDFNIGFRDKDGETVRGLVITGPNTGGKTVVLKTVGLFSLMSQCGLHIPAVEAEFCMRNMVLCDIGDGQSITENLSTFSAHMTRIIDILETADDQSLVLLDELGSGTDPTEGMGIATVVLEEVIGRGCLLAATTHYPEIKDFARNTKGFVNARMAFDRENLAPLYKLEIGEEGESCALFIARRIGLPLDMVERAHKAAYDRHREREDTIPEFDASEFRGIKDRIRPSSKKGNRLSFIDRSKEGSSKPGFEFNIGDSVVVNPDKLNGIVFMKADEKGMVGVQIKKKKYLVNHKRIELRIPASELYPDDYDFSIIFDTVENRKARHRMNKGHDANLVVKYEDEYEKLE